MRRTIGVVGLGNMGSALAGSLLDDGHEVVGCDVDPVRRRDHEARGGTLAATPEEVLAASELVLLSLPSARALETVLHGPGGLLATPRPGVRIVETGTFAVEDKRRAADAVAAAGMALLDCPISGTAGQARARDLVFYASGPATDVEAVRPLLESIGRAAPHVGEVGAGAVMKLVSNLLVTVHTVVAGEALNLAASAGLDLEQTLALLTSGSGSSRMLEVRGPMIVADHYPGDSATVRLLSKDVQLILGLAEEHDAAVPLLSVAAALMAAARGAGLGEADPAAVARVLAPHHDVPAPAGLDAGGAG